MAGFEFTEVHHRYLLARHCQGSVMNAGFDPGPTAVLNMDPLSIIASSITLITASIASTEVVINFISGIRNFDAEISATAQEISEFRLILVELRETLSLEQELIEYEAFEIPGGRLSITDRIPAASDEAQERIKRAREKIVEVEASVRKINSSNMMGRLRLLERKRLTILRQDLREMKLSISAFFSVRNGGLSVQSLVSIQHLVGYVYQASRDQSHQGHLLNEIHGYTRLTQGLQDEQRRTRELIEALNDRMRNQCQITPTLQHSPRLNLLAPLSHGTVLMNPSQDTEINTPCNEGHSNIETVIGVETKSTYYSSVFKLDNSRFRKTPCRNFCACPCHRRRRRRTNGTWGRLALGYSNLPFSRPACIGSCLSRTPFSATITYRFPTWIFNRLISLIFITSIFGDPWMGIKVRPMTSIFNIFRFASIGEIEEIKKLLARKDAHPSASFYGGWTALHYAISNGHANVCRLLLNEQADPMIEDGANSLSALEWAWIKILGKSFSPSKTIEFESIFNDRECLEEMGFSRLHKLVLGIESGDLSSEIANLDEVARNAPDNEGRTALSWAAQRGDLDTLNCLLSVGADPNLATPSGMAPLHYASEATNSLCIQPLLSAGADIHCVDHGLHTPLHFAAKHEDDLTYLEPLIRAGIDINARTDYSYTPLICAIYQNHQLATAFLLDNGADIDLRGQYDKTPIMYAVEYNAYDCLRLLLDRGADCTLQCDIIPTIAHMAATFADLRTIEILNDATLPYFTLDSLSLEDRDGMIIDERINTRILEGDCDAVFRARFDALLTKITSPQDLMSEVEEDNELEEFVDAYESWQ